MEQPLGFISATNLGYVCKLNKALYGFKKSAHAWYTKLNTYLLQCGFQGSKSDTSLFFSNKGSSIIILLIYVDDIIITGSHSVLVNSLIDQLHNQFALKDLGSLSYFLGIQVTRTPSSLHLCQHKYIVNLLHRAQMFDCKHASTLWALHLPYPCMMVCLFWIHLYTTTLWGLYSIVPSLDLKLVFLLARSVNSCILRPQLIGKLLRGFFIISRVQFLMAFLFNHLLISFSLVILMLIGLTVRMIEKVQVAIFVFLALI